MGKRWLRGVSLIEILISVVVLSLGLIAVVNCIHLALVTSLKAYRIDQATAIAESKIEFLRSTGEANVNKTVTEPLTDTNIPHGQVTYEITDYNTSLHLKKLRVTVTWSGSRTHQESVEIITLVGDRARYT